jgi:hypothetical protein
MRVVVLLLAVAAAGAAGEDARGQRAVPSSIDPLYAGYDELLDLYVRDGFVYYNAIRSDRSRLDRFISELGNASPKTRSSPDEQKAFWINAYNAFVLRTVIDHFPIRGRAAAYPSESIRQIPGAFERRQHRAAGRTVTLDQIEKEILLPIGDARVFFAINRGSVGGPRLRSEAFDVSKLESQLEAATSEAVGRRDLIRIDRLSNQLSLSPLFSWREAAFVASFADKADKVYAARSPLERAALAIAEPYLFGAEAEFLRKNEFRTVFHEFNWRLNDLNSRAVLGPSRLPVAVALRAGATPTLESTRPRHR